MLIIVLGGYLASANTCWNLLRTDHKGIKIEIGAADRPLCPDCLQIDRYRSMSELQTGIHDSGDSEQKWAAAKSGLIADARSLPFKDGTVSLIASKRFPWFGENARKMIRSVLREYRRILAANGSIVLLSNHGDPGIQLGRRPGMSDKEFEQEKIMRKFDPFFIFRPHMNIAARLGFKIRLIDDGVIFGIVLTHSRGSVTLNRSSLRTLAL